MLHMLTRLFGSRNDRLLKKMQPMVARINALEEKVGGLDDAALAGKTAEFRARLERGEALDALLPEAFAVVREASRRVLGMRHFDVQLIGGIILHQGKIAEMKTGEGKTLVATLPSYLNALTGKGVHVVTVNDYLARRDAEWMGRIYRFLGLSVGVIVHDLDPQQRQAAYAADITYGTNNEFGFDYLRDNMVFRKEDRVQRGHHYAIVDEVDSILIDEARTPLIISGPSDDAGTLYQQADALIKQLEPAHYEKDEKDRAVSFTEEGMERIERLCVEAGLLKEGASLYDPENVNVMHAVTQALRANTLFTREVDYIVRGNEVVIIDEFPGRMMPGRRYSDGQHQALEAKEGVPVQPENQTLASITFQNYFRMYEKLAGMTGTADTEAEEFQKIYGLEVVIVPTNKPMIRKDEPDLVFIDQEDKFHAIVGEIEDAHKRGQPVLVGTISIEKSEMLSAMLKQRRIPHEVLNAKNHAREAEIVAQAGRKGAVTIATNMAGRGTDIVLGGNPEMLIAQLPDSLTEEERERRAREIRASCAREQEEVKALGGLYIIASERHESRRIDNQLRGRAGRQGDPGVTRFFLSMEDDLMRIFGGEKMQAMLGKLGFKKGEVIEHPWVTRAVENAQKKVEGRNFDIRKQLLEYDDVMNQQRDVIYSQRRELMEAEDVRDVVDDMTRGVVEHLVARFMPPTVHAEEWDLDGLGGELRQRFALDVPVRRWVEQDASVNDAEEMVDHICDALAAARDAKEALVGAERMRAFEQHLLLQVLDHHWKEHLLAMDHLRQSVGLRGYAQKQPLQEYKRESFELFSGLIDRVREEVVTLLHSVQVQMEPEPDPEPEPSELHFVHQHDDLFDDEGEKEPPAQQTVRRTHPKVGRNDPCPCGSGKKYKRCHGRRG
ncbi:MAG: preprotein translocase subunit SecA [Zetaproteobacteria bacterium]|nr:MAG: preprotein translocase subunit SecA [Zetaproteobacteria bacterium]